MLLVVGLGNPGREYASHRHNVGFMVLDELARAHGADPFRSKFSGAFSRLRLGGEELLLLKPQTFMNESGRSVGPAAGFFRVPPTDVLVIHDELDLPAGELRLKRGGGHAGHNGLRSIISCLGSPDFGRIRIGIGHPPPGFRADTADWVLAPFEPEVAAQLPTILKTAVESVLDIAARGFEAAMKTRNTKPSKKRSGASADESPAGELQVPAGSASRKTE
jgi:peptidyl-tRNA hydrolase, PTH1 family